MYVGFIDLEKVHEKFNREVLRMFDGKPLNIKSMYINSFGCLEVCSKLFRNDSGVRQGCVLSHWLFILYTGGTMKDVKMDLEECE